VKSKKKNGKETKTQPHIHVIYSAKTKQHYTQIQVVLTSL